MTEDLIPCGGDCGSTAEDHIGVLVDGQCVLFSDMPWWRDNFRLQAPDKDAYGPRPAK